MKMKFFALSAVLAIAGVACSSSTGGGALQSPPVTTSAPPAAASVSMNDQLKFVPETITVAVGTTVTWTNVGTTPHTVTSDTGAWTDSGTINKGQKFSHTFTTAGTFKYKCTVHPPNMIGTVVVS